MVCNDMKLEFWHYYARTGEVPFWRSFSCHEVVEKAPNRLLKYWLARTLLSASTDQNGLQAFFWIW